MTGRALAKQLRPKIEEMLIGGADASTVAGQLAVKVSTVYAVKHRLKMAGKLR